MSKTFELSHLMAVTVSGPDALAFCQSQLTADMVKIAQGRWQITAWCDPKGRCQSVILASVHEDRVELVAPQSQAGILARLAIYAIGRRVSLSEPMPVAGSWPPEASGGTLSDDPARSLLVNQVASPDPEAEHAWRITDLCQGIPWLPPGQVGRHLPQSLGFEHNGGLSYRKGCFPGQEVIARVHYLGKVKYQLLGFILDDGLEIDSESRLLTADRAGQGEILEHFQIEDQTIGLAVCPSSWPIDTAIQLSASETAPSGRMVGLEGLCYYRPK